MPSPCNDNPRFVGDPVDTLTGAVNDAMLDFRLTGPIELRWFRHYDSGFSHRTFSVGNGCAHEYDRSLAFDAEGMVYEEPVGRTFRFPFLTAAQNQCHLHGFTFERVSERCYRLFRHAAPALEFIFLPNMERARLARLFNGVSEVRFVYSRARKLVQIIDSVGRHLTAQEDDGGRLIHLEVDATPARPGYVLITYRYDGDGNLVATHNHEGHGYEFAYDTANRMTLRRGRKGFQFYFTYDEAGRCIRAMGDDRLYGVALDYAVPGRLTRVTRPDRGIWTYKFTSKGELADILDPVGGSRKFIHDALGKPVLELDPNGNATTFVYDASGALIASNAPLGQRSVVPKDMNVLDPLSHRVAANAAEYECGRLLDVNTLTLPSHAQVASMSLSWEARSYVVTKTAFPEPPSPSFTTRPLGAIWWPKPYHGQIFNDLAKLQQQVDDFGRQRQWTYDESGNEAEYIDFDGSRWLYDYPAWHFLRSTTNPIGAQVCFTYTPYGRIASFTDAAGTRSEYRYDLKDNLVEVCRDGLTRETYTRDMAGNVIAKHARDARELLRIEVGPGNLPVRRTLASGDEHAFRYDRSGRPLLIATKQDRTEFAYDDHGQCVSEKRNGQGVSHRFAGWRVLAETVFFDRFVVSFSRDPDGTLIITDPGGQSHRISFHPHGIQERQFGNGSQEIIQYDSVGRCLFKLARRKGAQPWGRRYQWSGEGELRRAEDTIQGEIRHEYDAAHRLRRRHVGDHVETYQMDAADNLLAQPGLHGLVLRQANRIRSANGFDFTYNDRDHVALIESQTSRIAYFYDSRDQLVRAETPNGTWQATYDPLGRRTRKTWNGLTTEYFWNGDQMVAECHPDGRLRIYVYPDLLAATPLFFLDYDATQASPSSCKRYFIFSDQVGAPLAVEDQDQSEVWRAHVAPFGRTDVRAGAKIELNLRFPGHYHDPELGLHYNRFRYYDPCLGRYLQSDPWGIAGGYNLYAYCTNPLLTVDVRGLGGSDENTEEGEKKPTDAEATDKSKSKTEEPLPPMPSEEELAAMRKALVQATKDEAKQVAADPSLTNNEKGPVVTGVVDPRFPEDGPFFSRNTKGQNFGDNAPGEKSEPPTDVMAARLADHQTDLADGKQVRDQDASRNANPADHSECSAADQALKNREARTGQPATEQDLAEMQGYNSNTKDGYAGKGNPKIPPGEGNPPRCDHCQSVTGPRSSGPGMQMIGDDGQPKSR